MYRVSGKKFSNHEKKNKNGKLGRQEKGPALSFKIFALN